MKIPPLATLTIVLAGFLALGGCGRLPSSADAETGGGGGPAVRANWQSNFAAAQTQAKAENKLVLLDFTGSDWCGWCIKMNEEVFDTQTFKNYADANLVLVELDFPHSKTLPAATKEQNESLALKYGIEGFPTFVVLDPQGRKADEMVGYQSGGPKAFIAKLKKLAPAPRPATAEAAQAVPATPTAAAVAPSPAPTVATAPPAPEPPAPAAATPAPAPAAPTGGGIVRIRGQVANQAILTIPPGGLNLTRALALAGGPKGGRDVTIIVTRKLPAGGTEEHKIDFLAAQQNPRADFALQAGDVVTVSSAAPTLAAHL